MFKLKPLLKCLALLILCSCHSRPNHPLRINSLGVINAPAPMASIDQFRAGPSMSRALLAPPQIAEHGTATKRTTTLQTPPEVQGVPITVQWNAIPGHYRILFSDDGATWKEHSYTTQFRGTNIVTLLAPTNQTFKVVSP